jgi:hypothetical protein
MSPSRRFTLADVSRLPKRAQDEVAAQLYAVPNKDRRKAPAPVVERRDPHPLAKHAPAETGDSGKHLVRVTSFRVVLLDEDNLCEKYHVDALRYSGLLPSDAPGRCRIITSQEKVAHKADERTEIVIELAP